MEELHEEDWKLFNPKCWINDKIITNLLTIIEWRSRGRELKVMSLPTFFSKMGEGWV